MQELTKRRLTRSPDHKMIAGVCGGIADWAGWDPTLVRVLFVLASVLVAGVPGVLLYLVLWAVMPERASSHEGIDVVPVQRETIASPTPSPTGF